MSIHPNTDNGTEFVNQVMSEYYEGVGIFHQKSVPRTPQQNGVVERRNRTLVEAARTMMIFSKAPMFLWAEAVATACYTQNRSLIHTRHNKTPYELVHDKKPDLTFLRVFGALCYPTNDSEDLGKFQAKADIGIFVGYAPSRKGYRIYNKRTRRLMETIYVTFDEMHQTMALVSMSSGPEPIIMTPGQLKSGLAPTDKELEMLFQPMFDEYLEQSRVNEPVPSATADNAQVVPPGTSLSTTIAQDAPSTSASSSTSDMHHPVLHQGIAEEPTLEDSPITHDVLHPSFNPVTGEPGSAQSSSGNVNLTEPNQVTQPPDHLRKWTKDHPLDNIVGNPSRPVSTRKQLASDALWCCFHTELSKVEPKNFKMAVIEDCWFQAMQDEIHEFDRLEVSSGNLPKNIHCKCRNQEYDQSIRWDVKTAFLNGDLQEEVFVSQPEGFGRPDITANVPKSTLKLRSVFRYLKGTINMDYGIEKTNAYVPNSLMQMRIMRVSRFKKRVTSGKVLSFLEIDWLAGSSRNNEARQYQLLEAEYIAISGCCAQILWMLIPAQRTNGFDFNKIPLYLDNKSAIALCCNNVQHSRSKHINIRHHFIREQVENRVIFSQRAYKRTNSMAEQNVPAQPPTRTDEQIVPRSQWLTIGKSNLLFNAQKIQKNPIFQISVDILKNTNFFQALTASANVPAIYLQQFWKTMSYNEKTGVYSCQLDEQWFDLSADLLRKALAITPVNPSHPFELPPTGDTVLDFVNELGYPEPVEFVSSIRTNYVHQPWRVILSLLNQCLTGKTSGSDKPRHPVLQMLWGIVTQTNVDHAELIWEEFTQGIQTFFSHKASHKTSLKNPTKKATPLLIPYGRFSKVIIYYLARNNNIHRRPDSAVHHTGDDYVL
ncbi:retrovirus-related pol polyprotein from transposon TNT 1-94 [Tanacetum coccineum]